MKVISFQPGGLGTIIGSNILVIGFYLLYNICIDQTPKTILLYYLATEY